MGLEFFLLLLNGAVLLASVFGGFGPGLVATALATIAGQLILTNSIASISPELRRLAAEGVLLSIVGGTLRSAREKARQRLEATLRLEQQILEIGDDERQRVGHDLHDGLGQHLTGISLLSETMSQQIAAGRSPDPENVERITLLVSQAVEITRDIAKTLSPVTLEQEGLIAAIEELADTSSTLLGVDCEVEFDDSPLPLDRTRSLHLYRIVQEAVNNSVRHGKAPHVRIFIQNDGHYVRVQVIDDGSGLSEKTMNNPGLGLRIMQYRARILGATLTAERASPASGTVVTCTCPVDGGRMELKSSKPKHESATAIESVQSPSGGRPSDRLPGADAAH